MSAEHIYATYGVGGEQEIIENLRAGSASLLALLESWPDNGKLATITGAVNTLEGLRHLLIELQAQFSNDSDHVA